MLPTDASSAIGSGWLKWLKKAAAAAEVHRWEFGSDLGERDRVEKGGVALVLVARVPECNRRVVAEPGPRWGT